MLQLYFVVPKQKNLTDQLSWSKYQIPMKEESAMKKILDRVYGISIVVVMIAFAVCCIATTVQAAYYGDSYGYAEYWAHPNKQGGLSVYMKYAPTEEMATRYTKICVVKECAGIEVEKIFLKANKKDGSYAYDMPIEKGKKNSVTMYGYVGEQRFPICDIVRSLYVDVQFELKEIIDDGDGYMSITFIAFPLNGAKLFDGEQVEINYDFFKFDSVLQKKGKKFFCQIEIDSFAYDRFFAGYIAGMEFVVDGGPKSRTEIDYPEELPWERPNMYDRPKNLK